MEMLSQAGQVLWFQFGCLAACRFFAIGIIGEYIGKTYLETKKKTKVYY